MHALQVYRAAPPLARVEPLRYTTLEGYPLIRVVGLDLPEPQRWSLCQIKDELSSRSRLAAITVCETAAYPANNPGAVRVCWPQA